MRRDSGNPLSKGTTMDSLINTAAKRGRLDGLRAALGAVVTRGKEADIYPIESRGIMIAAEAIWRLLEETKGGGHG